MIEFRYDTQLLIEGENLDEDEIYRFMESGGNACPFYERYDEYGIVKKQN